MRSLLAVPLLALLFACSGQSSEPGQAGSFEFRDAHRPSYGRAVSVQAVTTLAGEGARVLDVRLPEDFDADPVLIPGASYQNPEQIDHWVGQMSPAEGPVVVYCVAGKWVSQKAASILDEAGFDVYTLEGGIEAWKAAGNPTTVSP